MLELPPLSLYVHIPWCVRKCPYCDFNSHEQQGPLPQAEYIQALCEDLDSDLDWAQGRRLNSIFIGGGTPSLFDASALSQLLQHIDRRIGISTLAEITLEANPGTAEADRFRDYYLSGINRLSIGIQSFNDDSLQRLGRIHDSGQAHKAVDLARQAGFDNINLDLMHGLPEQEAAAAMTDLDQAIAFEPEHISWYQLTIEPNTLFYRHRPPLPADNILESIQDLGSERLAQAGYSQYEVSAFSRGTRQSMHNLNYWCFGDYLGIGAGAHGKITQPEHDRILRSRKVKQPRHYLASQSGRKAESVEVEGEERALEFLLNTLRQPDGFPISQFEARTGLPFSHIGKRVEYLQQQGLLSSEDGFIRTTSRGYQLLNTVLEKFIDGPID
jgi:oxygen-independent coproporphyrinogen-3 oxidase